MRKMSQYIGQRIVYSGFIERWNTKEVYTDLLLTNVKIRPYKGNEISFEDHFWLKIKNEDTPSTKGFYRLDSITGLGLVKPYYRKDGSKDVTVEQVPALASKRVITVLEKIDELSLNVTQRMCCKQNVAKLIGLLDLYCQTMREFINLVDKEEVMTHIDETYDEIISFCNNRLQHTKKNIKLIYPHYEEKPLPARVIKLQEKIIKKITPSHKLKKGFC